MSRQSRTHLGNHRQRVLPAHHPSTLSDLNVHRCARASGRQGAIAALTALLMVPLIALVAFAIDIGYLLVVQSQLQNSADAAALASVVELVHPDRLKVSPDSTLGIANVRTLAQKFSGLNTVAGSYPQVDPNAGNSSDGEVVVGLLEDPKIFDAPLDNSGDPNKFNSVQVSVRKTADRNGPVSLFFARVIGFDSIETEATATATMLSNMRGVRATDHTGNASILPFTFDVPTWNEMLNGNAADNWTWNDNGTITPGPDGILEVNLFPYWDGSLPAGNRGTIDIGSAGNSTADLVRQILTGVSKADLAYHGGELKLDGAGKMYLNGDTGLSAGMESALISIKGEPRVIPLFEAVTDPDNTATFTIVGWAGIRILDVKLSGNPVEKRVIIQPAHVVDDSFTFDSGPSYSFYALGPPRLSR